MLLFQSSYASEQSLYELCQSTFEKGDHHQAQRHAELFRRSYPNSKWLEEVQFISASSEPDFISSESQYLKLIEKNGKWAAKSRLELAQRYFLRGNFDKAISHSKSIIETVENPKQEAENSKLETRNSKPDQVKAHYLLCKSLMAKRLYDQALSELKKLEELDIPESQISEADIKFKIAECHFQKSEYDKAIEIYRHLLEKYPESRWIYLVRQRELECQQKRKSLTETEPGNSNSNSNTSKLKEPKSEGGIFSIQVGAFTDRDNALETIDFLKNRGYDVSLIYPGKDEPKLFRVRVGSFKSEEEAKKVAQKLRRSEGLPAKIVFEK